MCVSLGKSSSIVIAPSAIVPTISRPISESVGPIASARPVTPADLPPLAFVALGHGATGAVGRGLVQRHAGSGAGGLGASPGTRWNRAHTGRPRLAAQAPLSIIIVIRVLVQRVPRCPPPVVPLFGLVGAGKSADRPRGGASYRARGGHRASS